MVLLRHTLGVSLTSGHAHLHAQIQCDTPSTSATVPHSRNKPNATVPHPNLYVDMRLTPVVMNLAVSLASLTASPVLGGIHHDAHVEIPASLHPLHNWWRIQDLFGDLLRYHPLNRT